MRQYEEFKYESLLHLLSNVLIGKDKKDEHIWKPSPSRYFLVRFFSLAMDPASIDSRTFLVKNVIIKLCTFYWRGLRQYEDFQSLLYLLF